MYRAIAVLTTVIMMRLVCTQGSVVVVNSGREFVAGVANPDVHTVVLQGDIALGPSDWDGFPSPIPILRNFTVLGDGSAVRGVRPVLDAGFQQARVRLGHMVTFEFRGVSLINIAARNVNLATNLVLFAACLPGEVGVVSLQECFGILELCYPAEMQAQVFDLITRPTWLPGPQRYKLHLPQDGCVNVTAGGAAAVPLEHRCWPQFGLFVDLAVFTTDADVNQKQVSLGYAIHAVNVTYACNEQLPYDCVETLGTVGCVTAWLAGALSPPPPTAAPAPTPPPANSVGSSDQGTHYSTSSHGSAGGSRGGALLGAILGGVLGGILGITCAAAAAALLVTRHRRRQPGARYARSASDEAGKANACCQAAVKAELRDHSTGTAPQSGKTRGVGTPACYDGTGGATVSTALGSRSPGDVTPTVTCVVAPSEGERQLPMRASRLGFGRADPLVPVTPSTPPRPDVALGARPGREVTLLPTVLGKGAFGRVVEGVYQGRTVAVKVLLDTSLEEWGLAKDLRVAGALGCTTADGKDGKNGAARDPKNQGEGEGGGHVGDETNCALVGSLVQEVEVLGRCRHPNVVTLLAACLEPPRFCLVMERMETSLDKMLYGNGPGHLLPMQEVLSIVIDVARGLEYLHPTVLHRDLKPANVLVNSPGSARMVAKLSDFGLSRLRHTVVPTANPEVGTPEYMAPELFSLCTEVVTDRADVYSFGVLLWAMLSGQRPWEDLHMVVIAVRITLQQERPPLHALPRGRSTPKLHRLISQCWEAVPERRPAAAELVKELLLVREQLLSEPDQIQRPELPGPSSGQ